MQLREVPDLQKRIAELEEMIRERQLELEAET